MNYIVSILFGGLAIFFLFRGAIPAITEGNWMGAIGFGLLCVGAIMVANGINSQFSSRKDGQ